MMSTLIRKPAGADQFIAALFLSFFDKSIGNLLSITFTSKCFFYKHIFYKTKWFRMEIIFQKIEKSPANFLTFLSNNYLYSSSINFGSLNKHVLRSKTRFKRFRKLNSLFFSLPAIFECDTFQTFVVEMLHLQPVLTPLGKFLPSGNSWPWRIFS